MLFHITENVNGMVEQRIIPEAMDPKNVGIEDESLLIDVFYFIDGKRNSAAWNFIGGSGAGDIIMVLFIFQHNSKLPARRCDSIPIGP